MVSDAWNGIIPEQVAHVGLAEFLGQPALPVKFNTQICLLFTSFDLVSDQELFIDGAQEDGHHVIHAIQSPSQATSTVGAKRPTRRFAGPEFFVGGHLGNIISQLRWMDQQVEREQCTREFSAHGALASRGLTSVK